PARQWHVRRIARQIEAVDRTAHHLLFPMIIEIWQQRGTRAADSGMNIAVDPRGRHAVPSMRSLDAFPRYRYLAACSAAARSVPPPDLKRKRIAWPSSLKSEVQPFHKPTDL